MTDAAIYCTTCGVENPGDSMFCAECGSRLAAEVGPGAMVSPPVSEVPSVEVPPPAPADVPVESLPPLPPLPPEPTPVPAWGGPAVAGPVASVTEVPAWGDLAVAGPVALITEVPTGSSAAPFAPPLPPPPPAPSPLPPMPPVPSPAPVAAPAAVNRRIRPLLPPPVEKRDLPWSPGAGLAAARPSTTRRARSRATGRLPTGCRSGIRCPLGRAWCPGDLSRDRPHRVRGERHLSL